VSVYKFFLPVRTAIVFILSTTSILIVNGAIAETVIETYVEKSENISLYREQLQTLELELGHYSYQLIEPLQQLANAQINANRFSDAEAIFDRAAHITRIEDGLYTPLQYPFLQQEIEMQMARGDWDEVNEHVEHYAWLIGEKFQGVASDRLSRMRWMAAVHGRGSEEDKKDNTARHLIRSTSLNELAVQYAQLNRIARDTNYAELLLELANAYGEEVAAIRDGGSTSYRLRIIVPGLDILEDKKEAVEKRYLIGLEKLEMRRDLLAELAADDHSMLAEAELVLARWHESFGKSEASKVHAQRAENLLTAKDSPASALLVLYPEAQQHQGAD